MKLILKTYCIEDATELEFLNLNEFELFDRSGGAFYMHDRHIMGSELEIYDTRRGSHKNGVGLCGSIVKPKTRRDLEIRVIPNTRLEQVINNLPSD